MAHLAYLNNYGKVDIYILINMIPEQAFFRLDLYEMPVFWEYRVRITRVTQA